MNPVDRPLLDIGLTRLEFLRISGKGLAGLRKVRISGEILLG